MNDKTESWLKFRSGSARRRCAQPRFGGPDRDGRSLDVDRREVAGRSRECFSKCRARPYSGGAGQCPVRIERKRRIGEGRRGFDIRCCPRARRFNS